jgi:hypothetical protein
MANILDMDKKEETGLLSSALGALDAPRQFLLEKVIEGQTGKDVERGSLNFGDVMENFAGPEFMANNPRTYAAISTIGDLLVDPLNFIPFGGMWNAAKNVGGKVKEVAKGEGLLNFGNVALGQEITRMDKAGQLNKFGGWYSGDRTKKGFMGSPAMSKIKHMTLGMVPDAFKNMAKRGIDSKTAYLFDEFGLDANVVKELDTLFKQKRMLDEGADPVVLNRNGKPLTFKDLDEKFLNRPRIRKEVESRGLDAEVTMSDLHYRGANASVQNELLSQLEYVGSTLQKYFPDSKRHKQFMENLKQDLFPETAFTDAAKLSSGDSSALSKIYPEIDPQILSDHIAPFITKEWGLKGPVVVNSKNFHKGMLNKLRDGYPSFLTRGGKRYHAGTNLPGLKDSLLGPVKEFGKTLASEGYSQARKGLIAQKGLLSRSSYDEIGKDLGINYIDAVGDLSKNMDFISKEGLIKEAIRRNKEYDEIHSLVGSGKKGTKKEAGKDALEARELAPLYFDIDGLKKAIKETPDGTVSVGAPALLDDRLLAHAAIRLVIPKGGREGFLVGFDQMKLGSIKALDTLVDMGSKYNFIAGDVEKVLLDKNNMTGISTVKDAKAGPRKRIQNTETPSSPKFPLAEQERVEKVMQTVEGMLNAEVPRAYAAKRMGGLLAPYIQGAHMQDKLDDYDY